MSVIQKILKANALVISPIKLSSDQSLLLSDRKTTVEVCEPHEATEWSLYARNEDGTVTWIVDRDTQLDICDLISRYGADKDVTFSTASVNKALPKFTSSTQFAVLPGVTGDNGVFTYVPPADQREPEIWALVAYNQTGESSMSYIVLGTAPDEDTAYFALAAILRSA